jgi:hypothetical protein
MVEKISGSKSEEISEQIVKQLEVDEAALMYFSLHPMPKMQNKIENAFKAGWEECKKYYNIE